MTDPQYRLGNCLWRIVSADAERVVAEREHPPAWGGKRATWPRALWDRLAKEVEQ